MAYATIPEGSPVPEWRPQPLLVHEGLTNQVDPHPRARPGGRGGGGREKERDNACDSRFQRMIRALNLFVSETPVYLVLLIYQGGLGHEEVITQNLQSPNAYEVKI